MSEVYQTALYIVVTVGALWHRVAKSTAVIKSEVAKQVNAARSDILDEVRVLDERVKTLSIRLDEMSTQISDIASRQAKFRHDDNSISEEIRKSLKENSDQLRRLAASVEWKNEVTVVPGPKNHKP